MQLALLAIFIIYRSACARVLLNFRLFFYLRDPLMRNYWLERKGALFRYDVASCGEREREEEERCSVQRNGDVCVFMVYRSSRILKAHRGCCTIYYCWERNLCRAFVDKIMEIRLSGLQSSKLMLGSVGWTQGYFFAVYYILRYRNICVQLTLLRLLKFFCI